MICPTRITLIRYLDAYGPNYGPIFVVFGLAYVSALGVIHLLVPRLEPARLDG